MKHTIYSVDMLVTVKIDSGDHVPCLPEMRFAAIDKVSNRSTFWAMCEDGVRRLCHLSSHVEIESVEENVFDDGKDGAIAKGVLENGQEAEDAK